MSLSFLPTVPRFQMVNTGHILLIIPVVFLSVAPPRILLMNLPSAGPLAVMLTLLILLTVVVAFVGFVGLVHFVFALVTLVVFMSFVSFLFFFSLK